MSKLFGARIFFGFASVLAGVVGLSLASTHAHAAGEKTFMVKTSPYLLVRPAFDDKFKGGLGVDIEAILGPKGTFGFYFQYLSREINGSNRTDALFGFHTNVYVLGDTTSGGFIFRPKAGFGFPSTGGLYGHLGAGLLVQVIASNGLLLELGAQVMTRPVYLSGSAEGASDVQVEFLSGIGFTF